MVNWRIRCLRVATEELFVSRHYHLLQCALICAWHLRLIEIPALCNYVDLSFETLVQWVSLAEHHWFPTGTVTGLVDITAFVVVGQLLLGCFHHDQVWSPQFSPISKIHKASVHHEQLNWLFCLRIVVRLSWDYLSSTKYSLLHRFQKWFKVLLRYSLIYVVEASPPWSPRLQDRTGNLDCRASWGSIYQLKDVRAWVVLRDHLMKITTRVLNW